MLNISIKFAYIKKKYVSLSIILKQPIMKPTVNSLNSKLASISQPGKYRFEVGLFGIEHVKGRSKSVFYYSLNFEYDDTSGSTYGFILFCSSSLKEIAAAVESVVNLINVNYFRRSSSVGISCVIDDDLPF